MKPNVSPIASGPSDDMLCRLLNSHHRTVDAEIIILRNPPISAGIGVIVFFSLFINFSDGVLRFFWPEALDLHPASDTIPEGSADEQADHRDAGRFEDGIGTPPHNNAGIFLGKFQDHLALHLKQDVLRRLALPHLRSALIDAGKEPGIGCFFLSARGSDRDSRN